MKKILNLNFALILMLLVLLGISIANIIYKFSQNIY